MASAQFDPTPLLMLLMRHEVDFVLIGGVAAAARGSRRATSDVDIAYSRDDGNLERLAEALREVDAKLRRRPKEMPLLPDAETLEHSANFTAATREGQLDILGAPIGAPSYRVLRAAATTMHVHGMPIPVASLEHLIAMKDAAQGPDDVEIAAELRAISDSSHAS